jgi:hypothetical protein
VLGVNTDCVYYYGKQYDVPEPKEGLAQLGMYREIDSMECVLKNYKEADDAGLKMEDYEVGKRYRQDILGCCRSG